MKICLFINIFLCIALNNGELIGYLYKNNVVQLASLCTDVVSLADACLVNECSEISNGAKTL